ncbi:MAG TPA: ABC transporter permease [Nitrospirae bacterium]|nr:inner membrane transport permease YbhS [bacterium BMS3Abin10]GBE37533.1 inner membrane transport permease YbhS [bacterium BMS3Bbin08]HDH50089.1 ABC transporter permease [Nitrospirota bacterium]HDK41224.1 ABC transporter permease [Nitrospirota bacterium]HDK81776.1 ABC transporter permease [Nitrospirota bacterium]
MTSYFSISRFLTIIVKEFIQMRRDRLTFAMMIGIPVMQLVLFGYAINFDPKDLPVAVIRADESIFSRDLIHAMENSGYFRIIQTAANEEEARDLLELGDVQFVLNIPANFARRLLRGEGPSILLEADATDPVATGNAIAAMTTIVQKALNRDLKGTLRHLKQEEAPFGLRVHKKYNPEGVTNHNIVPGLMGIVLTLTMVIITGVAVTRERERGTMETLLSTPARPVEVITGKIIPYIIVGYIQVILILMAARFLFHIPMVGSLLLLMLVSLIFIVANLSMGVTFSTFAKNQMQAMQMAFFFFLPSLMLSGFMFPFRGMPEWAQWIGSALPLTHYLRLVRGILLKGNGLSDVLVHLWPIALFMTLALAAAIKRYRKTLD